MSKRLLFLLMLLIPSLTPAATRGSFIGYCQTSNVSTPLAGKTVPNCTVQVLNAYTGATATLYSDNVGSGTPLTNPFTVSGTSFTFYVDDGTYNLAMSGVVGGNTNSWLYSGVVVLANLNGSFAKSTGKRLTLPSQVNIRSVMATPPTTTLTTAHTIASPIKWLSSTTPGALFGANGSGPLAEYFTYTRAGAPALLGTTFANNQYTTYSSVNYGGGYQTYNVGAWSFLHYGSAVEIWVLGNGGTFLCKVNDQYITLTPTATPNDGNLYYFYIPFGSAAYRRVEFIGSNIAFGAVFTAATDTIQPAPVRGPRVIVVGDSFTEGTGATSQVSGYVQVMCDALGWDDCWPSGVGSTGWLNNGLNPKVKFGSRLSTDVYPFSPDIVIFAGGINDWTLFTPAQIQAEVTADIQAVQANVPGVTVVVLSPFWKGGASTFGLSPNTLIGARDAIKAAAQATGAFFIDLLEQPIPAGVTPVTTTLAAQASSGQAVISTNAIINIRSTIKFSNGERYQVKAETNASAPFSITLDANLATTHNSGETVTQVGDPWLTGSGNQGALTGYGNADILVSAGTPHPSDAGHNVLGTVIAQALLQALR
jgi:lysophospholipase L1-like esterase